MIRTISISHYHEYVVGDTTYKTDPTEIVFNVDCENEKTLYFPSHVHKSNGFIYRSNISEINMEKCTMKIEDHKHTFKDENGNFHELDNAIYECKIINE